MNKADLEEKQERRMRYGFLALLLLVLGGIHFMDPAFYPTVYQPVSYTHLTLPTIA